MKHAYLRPLSLALLPCLLIATGCGGAKPSTQQKPIVRYACAKSVTNGQASASYIGIVRGDIETDLSFNVSGILEFIGPNGATNWEEGAGVEKGQVLARLKQEEFRSKVNMAQADAEMYAKQYERNQKLLASGATSPQEFDILSARRKASEAALSRAKQELEDSTLLSPFSGTILTRLANPGETVSANKPVLRIANLNRMSVELGIPDRLLGAFRVGNIVKVNFSALEGAAPFDGVVSEVGVAARSEARLFRVLLKVDNKDQRLKSGMTATVPLNVVGTTHAKAVAVPISALVAANGNRGTDELAVFVLDEQGCARERKVKTGDLLGSSIMVTEGVSPGQKVVVVGAGHLYDGASVEAREMTSLQRF